MKSLPRVAARSRRSDRFESVIMHLHIKMSSFTNRNKSAHSFVEKFCIKLQLIHFKETRFFFSRTLKMEEKHQRNHKYTHNIFLRTHQIRKHSVDGMLLVNERKSFEFACEIGVSNTRVHIARVKPLRKHIFIVTVYVIEWSFAVF